MAFAIGAVFAALAAAIGGAFLAPRLMQGPEVAAEEFVDDLAYAD